MARFIAVRHDHNGEYNLRSRFERAISQPIRIIDKCGDRVDKFVNFKMRGAGGSTYNVGLTPDNAMCTCPDYQQRGHVVPCKHILYIYIRVLKMPAIEFVYNNHNRFEGYFVDYAGAYERSHRLIKTECSAGGRNERNERADLDCCICYDVLGISGLAKCVHCKHQVHSDCISIWVQQHPTCPLCRGVWCHSMNDADEKWKL